MGIASKLGKYVAVKAFKAVEAGAMGVAVHVAQKKMFEVYKNIAAKKAAAVAEKKKEQASQKAEEITNKGKQVAAQVANSETVSTVKTGVTSFFGNASKKINTLKQTLEGAANENTSETAAKKKTNNNTM